MTNAAPWGDLLGEGDDATVRRAGFAQRVGIGSRPAVLVIDPQNYMIGPPPGSQETYPSGCGDAGVRALEATAALLHVARAQGVPVFYTRFELRRDGSDIGVYRRKRGFPDAEGWCLEGSEGAAISPLVEPEPGDYVLVKKKPSAFLGTPLLGLLVAQQIDTVIVTGGSTSNCVRATSVDAASYNFRTIIPADCVFDRIDISHRVALFDLDRQYGDVMQSADVIEALQQPPAVA